MRYVKGWEDEDIVCARIFFPKSEGDEWYGWISMDIVELSRIQFALNISFHYLYPPISIGLSLILVFMEGYYLKTKKAIHLRMVQFWMGIFALSFMLGVATGLVQLFAFGTNWSRYSCFVGDVFGSALAAEGIFAFFLEAGCIGIMLFGWKKVAPKWHYLSTCCVSLGTHLSAFWIVSVNSWMQTPAGFKIVGQGEESHAVVTHFWQMVFNPSFLDRLTHVLIGTWLTGTFVLLSVSAYYLLKRRDQEFAYFGMKMGLIIGAILVTLMPFSADRSARGIAKYQPEKFAAIEGVYHTQSGAPMNLIGYVDSKERKVYSLKVPGLLSWLAWRDTKAQIKGLSEFPENDWPNVPVLFQLYHLMIYMWGLMLLAIVLGGIVWWRKRLHRATWTLGFLMVSFLFPWITNLVGWGVAEMGRQPWIVYKLLRVSQGISPGVNRNQVIGSIAMFLPIYLLLFFLFLYLVFRKIRLGPERDEDRASPSRQIKGEL